MRERGGRGERRGERGQRVKRGEGEEKGERSKRRWRQHVFRYARPHDVSPPDSGAAINYLPPPS